MKHRWKPDEVLTEIVVPVPGAAGRSAYLKFGYLERPSVGVALGVQFKWPGQLNADCRRMRRSGAPRVAEAEALLEGKSREEAERNLAQAGAIAGERLRRSPICTARRIIKNILLGFC